jgi:hypothetical protein
MEEMRIKLSALWVALMLTYLLGDVLRIFSGDFEAAKLGGKMDISPGFFLGMAALFVLPIVMGFLSSWLYSSLVSTPSDCPPTLRSMTSS